MKKKLGSMILAIGVLLGAAMPGFAAGEETSSSTLTPEASIEHHPEITAVEGDETAIERVKQPVILATHETKEVVEVDTIYVESKTTTHFFERFGIEAVKDAQATAGVGRLDNYAEVRTVEVFANHLAMDAFEDEDVYVTFPVPNVEENDVVMVARFVNGKYADSFKAVAHHEAVVFPLDVKELGTFMILKVASTSKQFVGSPTLDTGAYADHEEILVVEGNKKTIDEAQQPVIVVASNTEAVAAVNAAYIENETTTKFFESYGTEAVRDAKAAAGGQDLDSYAQVRTDEAFTNLSAIDEAEGEVVNVTFIVPGIKAGDVILVARFIDGNYAGSFRAAAHKSAVVFPVDLKNLGTYMILKQIKR